MKSFDHLPDLRQKNLYLTLFSGFLCALFFQTPHAAAKPRDINSTKSVNGSQLGTQQKDFNFAQGQIETFEILLGDLTERAQEEDEPKEIAKLKLAIRVLDRRVLDTRLSLEKAQSHPRNSFLLEHLRESVLALQEAGSRAVGRAIDADQTAMVSK